VYAIGRKRGTDVYRALSEEHPDDETWPELLILRTEGRLFFANAQRVADTMRPLVERAKPSVVLLDCSAVFDIEYTALKMLIEAEETLRREGITLWLAALNPQVLAVVRKSQLSETLGRERMFFNVQVAVEAHERNRSTRAGA
jgi:sulfate permease, SulP family